MTLDQVEEQRKIDIVNKINKRYQNLMHDVNKAEKMGIRVDIEIRSSELAGGQRLHHMQINCLDSHLMSKVNNQNNN